MIVRTFLNTYDCDCGETWGDTWCAICDDDCPNCGTTCSPTESEDFEEQNLKPGEACFVCHSAHA